jgi:hypothetical protein
MSHLTLVILEGISGILQACEMKKTIFVPDQYQGSAVSFDLKMATLQNQEYPKKQASAVQFSMKPRYLTE